MNKSDLSNGMQSLASWISATWSKERASESTCSYSDLKAARNSSSCCGVVEAVSGDLEIGHNNSMAFLPQQSLNICLCSIETVPVF